MLRSTTDTDQRRGHTQLARGVCHRWGRAFSVSAAMLMSASAEEVRDEGNF